VHNVIFENREREKNICFAKYPALCKRGLEQDQTHTRDINNDLKKREECYEYLWVSGLDAAGKEIGSVDR